MEPRCHHLFYWIHVDDDGGVRYFCIECYSDLKKWRV